MDTLLVILTLLLVDKGPIFHLYEIHDLPLLHKILQKSFYYETPYTYFTVWSDLWYINFPDDNNVLRCLVSTGHFCWLNIALHPVDKSKDNQSLPFE